MAATIDDQLILFTESDTAFIKAEKESWRLFREVQKLEIKRHNILKRKWQPLPEMDAQIEELKTKGYAADEKVLTLMKQEYKRITGKEYPS